MEVKEERRGDGVGRESVDSNKMLTEQCHIYCVFRIMYNTNAGNKCALGLWFADM